MDSDAELMLLFKQGDTDAFNRLMERYGGMLATFVYRLTGSRDDAEDLVQETFLRVYRAADRYEPSAKFTTWLFRIARNVCLDYLRSKSRDVLSRRAPTVYTDESGEEKPLELEDRAAPPAEKLLEQQQSDDAVRSALLELPENQRAAITLKVYEDRSYAEIAEILETSVPSVESLIFRARQSLKKLLVK